MVRLGLAFALVASWCAVAAANGRPAATSTINFEQGNPQNIAAGMTFGLLLSSDGGATWHWMCEKTVGYGGMYDPDYAYSSTGTLFATTFSGEKVMRDGCTFKCGNNNSDCSCAKTTTVACITDFDCPIDPMTTAPENCVSQFVSADELSPDHSLFVAAADPTDANIYKSTDNGVTFPLTATPPPGQNGDWWDSLIVAPANANVVYLSGYRFKKVCSATASNAGVDCVQNPDCPGGTCDAKKFFLMFRSNNAGASFAPISQTNINASNNSTIDFVSVDRTDATGNTVYIHVNLENGNLGDSIYKTTNGGGNVGDALAWKKILTMQDPFGLSFLARSDGTLIAASQTSGAKKSAGGAACVSEATCNWTDLAMPPHINCLTENPATYATTHEVWACTHNYDSPGIPGDGFGIMKSTDLASWAGVLKFQDIAGPVTCGTDTVQYQQCVDSYMARPSVWCCLKDQLGITDTSVDCSGARGCGVLPDSPSDGGLMVKTPKGCCESGGAGGSAVLSIAVLALLSRRRRQA